MNVAALKTVGVFALLGAVIGNALSTLISPGILIWWNTAGDKPSQGLYNSAEMSKIHFNQLIQAQLIGSAIGALVFVVIGVLVLRKRAKAAAASATAS